MRETNSTLNFERPIAAAVRANSDTMEDRLAISRPPVRDSGLDTCFTVIQDGSNLELLTVDPDNKMVHVRRANLIDVGQNRFSMNADEQPVEKSDSGWQSETVEVPDTRIENDRWDRGDIDEIRGFRQGNFSYALVHFPEKVAADHNGSKRRYIEPMVYDPINGWQSWRIEGEAGLALLGTEQTELFVDKNGRTIIYGKPTGYSKDDDVMALVYQDEAKGDWKTVLGVFPRTSTDYTYRLTSNNNPASIGSLFRVGKGAVVEYQHIGLKAPSEQFPDPRLEYSRSWKSVDLSQLIKGVGDLGASRFLDLPDQPASFVVHSSTTKQVYLVTHIESDKPVVTCLTDEKGAAQSADLVRVARDDSHAGGNAAAGEVRAAIIMIDATDERRLWIKRQTGTGQNGVPTFKDWVPLAAQIRTVAVPRCMSNGTELFVVIEQTHRNGFLSLDEAGGIAIEHKSFDHCGQAWHTEKIETTRESIDQADACITHTSELVLTTKDGTLARDALAYLTASYPCVAVVNGVGRHLSPTEPIRVYANQAGMINIKVKADSVDAPVFRIRLASADAEPQEILANGAVARRLAGRQKDHWIDQDRLCKAGLLPEKLRGTGEGKKLAEIVRQAGQAIGQANQGQQSNMREGAWYHGIFSPGNAPDEPFSLSIRSGHGSLPDERRIAGVTALEPELWSSGSAADGFGFVGDIINWIAQSAEKVAEWTISFGNACAEFIITLGKKVWSFVVNTASGLALGMEALFQAIARTVDVVIDAAKTLLNVAAALFDIPAIQRTNDCMVYIVNGGLLTVEKAVRDGLSQLVHDAADNVLKSIDTQLANLESFTKQLTLGQLGTSGIPDKADGSSSFQGKNDLIQSGGVQARWVGERVMTHIDRFDQVAAANLVAPQDTDQLAKKLLALADELINYDPKKDTLSKVVIDLAKDIQDDFKQGVQAINLHKIFTYVRRVIHCSTNLLVRVLDLLFELIADAIGLFRKFLNLTIDIPGVTQLAQLVLGRKLTVMDLLTFMYSVALTVFWKIISKGKEPFDEETKQRLLTSGILPTEDSSTQSDDSGASINLGAYLRVEMAKLFKQTPNPDDEEKLKITATYFKSIVKGLTPVVTVFNLIGCFVSATLGACFAAGADALDSIVFGAGGKTLGTVGVVIGVFNGVLSTFGILFSIVRNMTIKYLPESEEGKIWIKEQLLVPPGDWPSMSWLVGSICGFVSFVCCSPFVGIPQPGGAYAYTVICAIIGGFGLVGALVYTGFLIDHNKPRGWQIANEFGMIIGQLPLCFRWVPAINSKLITMVPWGSVVAVILIASLELTDFVCICVSNVTAIGSIIDENMAKEWLDFSASATSLAEC